MIVAWDAALLTNVVDRNQFEIPFIAEHKTYWCQVDTDV